MLKAKSLEMPMSEAKAQPKNKQDKKRENASEELLGHLTCGFLSLVVVVAWKEHQREL